MLLFVYGSLKRGFGNHHRLAAPYARFIGEATTVASFAMWGYGFPVVAPKRSSRGGFRVSGEVYEIDDRTLASCDALEGHPRWYRRFKVKVVLKDPITKAPIRRRIAWMYLQKLRDCRKDQIQIAPFGPGRDAILTWERV